MTLERRPLTFSESLFARARIGPVVATVSLQGRLDPAVMDQAARLLQRDYPLLRCRLHHHDDGIDLVLSEEGAGLAAGAPGPDTLANELNIQVEQDRPVSRIALSQNGDSAVLSLAGDHTTSDARLNTLLLHRLLDYYTDLLHGLIPAPSGRPGFEGSLEDVLLERYEARPVPSGADTEPPVTLAVDAAAPGVLAVRSLGYDPDTTAALIAAARQGGISITNLLSGSLACAVRAQFPADAGSMPVSAAFAVDLRPRVMPPIAPDAPFCCVARQVCLTHLDADDQPIEAGRRIGAQLREALDRDEIQHRLLAQRLAGRPLPLPPISYMVSNIGIVDDYRMPDGLRVTDSRWATTSRGPVPTLFGSTAAGSLNLDLVYDTGFHRADVIEDVVKHFEASLIGCR